MDFVFSFFSVIFIAVLIGSAIAFGFVILLWFIGAGVALTLFVYARELIRRWLFLHRQSSKPHEAPPPRVIEGEYTDITDLE